MRSTEAAESLNKLKLIHALIVDIKSEENRLSAERIEAELMVLSKRSGKEFDQLRTRLLPLLSKESIA
jgi:hypothetical protein